MLKSQNGDYKDIDVSKYANYYEVLFEGFDDCVTSDDDNSDYEDFTEEDKSFINDGNIEEDTDTDSSYNSIEELDIDENDYTGSDSDYDEECEGESD